MFYSIESIYQTAYALQEYNFGAAGDWDCNSNTDNTVNNMVGKNPKVVFGLGDYSYQSTGTCWFNKIAPIAITLPLLIHGNGLNVLFFEYIVLRLMYQN